ncbi:hemerythrin domain-containing protein [Magnetofaba australis]|uniref:Putative response regulator receiver protein n=1 Tax=Magnetofaba australis IT-1 TaxID=1434232 RepID=A0A1Y2K2H0_9PROT|nr:hemerythrin domain-containing protein [Magnetofaba australis]OSM02230.1 putative response regulator receiver protein [Magnetofaba australis IT-1]
MVNQKQISMDRAALIERVRAALPGSIRILYVDDNSAYQKIVENELLAPLGATVKKLSDGQAAFSTLKARNDAFDLLITDLDMPLMGGIELVNRLREINIAIPAIIMTSYEGLAMVKTTVEQHKNVWSLHKKIFNAVQTHGNTGGGPESWNEELEIFWKPIVSALSAACKKDISGALTGQQSNATALGGGQKSAAKLAADCGGISENIRWSPEIYGLDIPEVDEDHRNIVMAAANLQRLIADQAYNRLNIVIMALLKVTRDHLAWEEELQRINGYPGREGHAKLHKQLLAQLDNKTASYKYAKSDDEIKCSANQLTEFVYNWLKQHIQGEDSGYAKFLHKKPDGYLVPDKAAFKS